MTRQEFFEIVEKSEKEYNNFQGCAACNICWYQYKFDCCKTIDTQSELYAKLNTLKKEYEQRYLHNYDLDAFSLAVGISKEEVFF